MVASFNVVKPDLDKLRDFILNDLDKITKQRVGGNYAAVAVIGCACEALGRLPFGRDDGGREFFTRYLLPDAWRAVGPDLYDALRHGIAHGYETKTVRWQEHELEIGVSWRAKPHLTFNETRTMLYVNVRDLATSLREAFNRYEAELERCENLRDQFVKWWKRGRSVSVSAEGRVSEWQRLLGQ